MSSPRWPSIVVALVFAACGSSPPPTQPVVGTPPPPPPDAAPVARVQPDADSELPRECAEFRALVDGMSRCPGLASAAQQVRDATDQMWTTLADMPPDAREAAAAALVTGCKSGVESLLQSYQSAGCTPPTSGW